MGVKLGLSHWRKNTGWGCSFTKPTKCGYNIHSN